jgi:hypothetical protein
LNAAVIGSERSSRIVSVSASSHTLSARSRASHRSSMIHLTHEAILAEPYLHFDDTTVHGSPESGPTERQKRARGPNKTELGFAQLRQFVSD